MSPARRRKRLRELKEKKKYSQKFIFKPLIFVLVISLVPFLFAVFNKRCLLKNLKTTLTINTPQGDIVVASFDPVHEEITSFLIPGNTQMIASRQLGTWKAKSIWQLGVNEGYDGKLLQETISKNFDFPVTAWGESQALGFVSGNFLKIFKSIILPYKTNLSLGDRISLGFLSFRVKNEKNSLIDMSQVGVLRKIRLTDGEEGFTVSGKASFSFVGIFADTPSEKEGYRVYIRNQSGKRQIAEKVGRVIEMMGLKVMSIKEEEEKDIDCIVSGTDKFFVKKISQIFSCSLENSKYEEGFDIKLDLGVKFAKRF